LRKLQQQVGQIALGVNGNDRDVVNERFFQQSDSKYCKRAAQAAVGFNAFIRLYPAHA